MEDEDIDGKKLEVDDGVFGGVIEEDIEMKEVVVFEDNKDVKGVENEGVDKIDVIEGV